MRKWMLTLLITIFALPFFSSVVLADAENELENGVYEDIQYVIKDETDDVVSPADYFFEKPATLTVEDGRKYFELTINGSDMIQSIEVPLGPAEDGEEDEDSNSRIIRFEVEDDLTEPVMMNIHVKSGDYESTYTTRAFFDLNINDEGTEDTGDNNQESGEQPNSTGNPEAEQQQGDSEMEEPEEQSVENSKGNKGIIQEDGFYTIDFEALHLNRERPSAMASFMVGPAFVEKSDGGIELTIAVADQTVTELQVDDQERIDYHVDGDTRYDTFAFDSLPAELEGYVEYKAGEHESNAEFLIVFEDTSISEATEEDKYEPKYVAPEIPEPEEEQEKDEKRIDTKDNPEDVDPLTPDRAYEIDYVIKHENKDEESAANEFFQKPGILLYQGEDKYLQLKVTGKQFIDALSTDNGPLVIVEEGDDFIVVQLKVDGDISDMILLNMILTVPGVYDEKAHSARLFLFEDTMNEENAEDYRLAASDSNNDNGPTVEGEPVSEVFGTDEGTGGNNNDKDNNETNGDNDNDKTPDKPELGPGEDNNGTGGADEEGANPKTGDTSNIMLYVLLLIGSAIPLAIQLKRRFVS